MFSIKKKPSPNPPTVSVGAGVCEMFMIGDNLNLKNLITPSLLSCIACVFLSEKVGFIYHCNCGVINDSIISMIRNALLGNKMNLSNTQIVLAASGSEEVESSRMKEVIKYLEKQGFNQQNIKLVYNAPQYTVNSKGRHGIYLNSPLVLSSRI